MNARFPSSPSRAAGGACPTVRSERGYTIVELLVAVVIFSVGLLGMAGTASVIMSTVTSTKSRTIAASVAESRFEQMRATTCGTRAGGSAASRGISETWTLNRLTRADEVTVNVSFLSSHRKRTETFRTYLPC